MIGLVGADALDLAFLQGAQELHLRCSGRSPISSRKSVPLSAASKSPTRALTAPVKAPRTWPKSSLSTRSTGMAEQLTATKRAIGAVRVLVDGARDELFAGAALAENEHRGRGRRHAEREPVDLAHPRRVADELAEVLLLLEPLLEHVDAVEQLLALGRLGDRHGDDVVRRERLGEEIVGAVFHRGDGVVDVGEGGHHDDLDLGVLRPSRG